MPAASPAKDVLYLEVQGRVLRLSNLAKVLYPATGFTKKDCLKYYRRIAPVLLPHLKNRPLTMKRYPDGVDAEFFYEKNCPASHPDWVRTELFNEIRFCVIDDLPALMWVANLTSLELHTHLSLAPRAELPTSVVFDLDPGAPASLRECCRVALRLRERLLAMDLECHAKTSGQKGLQVYVPLNTESHDFAATREFSHHLARELERETPELVVTQMAKALRPGKVFIDWSQNDQHKTTVSVYSLRATGTPSISTPVTWEEVASFSEEGSDPASMAFLPDQVLSRVARMGDLFLPVLHVRQRLPAATRSIAK